DAEVSQTPVDDLHPLPPLSALSDCLACRPRPQSAKDPRRTHYGCQPARTAMSRPDHISPPRHLALGARAQSLPGGRGQAPVRLEILREKRGYDGRSTKASPASTPAW